MTGFPDAGKFGEYKRGDFGRFRGEFRGDSF
jgi:hypothetical protein